MFRSTQTRSRSISIDEVIAQERYEAYSAAQKLGLALYGKRTIKTVPEGNAEETSLRGIPEAGAPAEKSEE